MNTTNQAADLQAAIASLVATHGHADVLRAVVSELRTAAESHELDAVDYDECDDEEALDWAQAERDCGAFVSEQADAVEQAADAIDDAQIDRRRALGLE